MIDNTGAKKKMNNDFKAIKVLCTEALNTLDAEKRAFILNAMPKHDTAIVSVINQAEVICAKLAEFYSGLYGRIELYKNNPHLKKELMNALLKSMDGTKEEKEPKSC